jgi:hypothetical protein
MVAGKVTAFRIEEINKQLGRKNVKFDFNELKINDNGDLNEKLK